ncbi:hypothetical protein [Tranquillimonas alkanivorans]|uniref:Uncharacterized protein n=1 Tax=Tranquillimonas alkanivorans TaxID=441119 RepID=A0A1I5WCR5_9RHOB|nr:hypothetical protein [Tranquillimonas alkanivorans]SFQ17116.1 hypothetical protein SAMN04488047_1438 [Tranquillimonas alkanivorans]
MSAKDGSHSGTVSAWPLREDDAMQDRKRRKSTDCARGRTALASLVARGLIERGPAQRIAAALHAIETAGGDTWSVADLQRDPEGVIAMALSGHPQVLLGASFEKADPVVAISAGDLVSLIEAVTSAAGADFATGREMHTRLARSGPPLEITARVAAPTGAGPSSEC